MENWCEHIHDWGNGFYFVDCFSPFNVNEKPRWEICPICRVNRPETPSNHKPTELFPC